MLPVLLAAPLDLLQHPPLAEMGSGVQCFPRLHHACCRTYRKEKISCRTAAVNRNDNLMLNPAGVTQKKKKKASLFGCMMFLSVNLAANSSSILFANATYCSGTLTSVCLKHEQAAQVAIRQLEQ